MVRYTDVSAVILAGGASRRMGQHKALLSYQEGTFLSHLITQLEPQVAQLVIGGSPEAQLYNDFAVTTLFDPASFQGKGPLVGVLSAMRYVQTPFLLSVPCDSPRLPVDMIMHLMQALTDQHADIAMVHDGERQQPLFALIKTALKVSLTDYLLSGKRKVFGWLNQHNTVTVDFTSYANYFCNINTVDDYQRFIDSAPLA